MTKLKPSAPPASVDTADLKYNFVQQLSHAWSPENWIDGPVVLAVSGGADSVAMLLGIKVIRDQYKHSQNVAENSDSPQNKETVADNQLIVGHFNHGMRGSEADEDAAFVQSLCTELGLPYEIGQVNESSFEKTPREGWESTYRQMRYAFLLELAERHGARYVATGHTAEDQAETILHRILRGTGLRGLSGMPRSRALSPAVSLIRPMLTIARSTAREYLQSLDMTWQSDSSNDNSDFTRNQIRNDLLPMLEKNFNPQVTAAILRLGRLAAEAQQTIEHVTETEKDRTVRQSEAGKVQIDLRSFAGHPDFLVREILIATWRSEGWPLQGMGLDAWQKLADLAQQTSNGSLTLPGGVIAKKEGGKLSLHRPQ